MKENLKEFLRTTEIEAELINPSGNHRTAKQAAKTLNVSVGSIIKSLVFKSGEDYFLVVVPGDGRADIDKLSEVLGKDQMEIASPPEVEEVTGFSVGTVPPVGTGLPKVVDKKVLDQETVYGGGGSEKQMIMMDPRFIVDEESVVADVCED